MVAAVGPGQLGLLPAADGADHRRPEVAGPLADDQADPAGGGVDQDRVAGADAEGAPQQVLGGHPLQHHRRGAPLVEPVGEFDQAVGGNQPFLGVGPGGTPA